jgi:alkylation response protein AidB-like acyl-CoA dehydrogenase
MSTDFVEIMRQTVSSAADLEGLLAEIAAGAAVRERERIAPHDEIRRLARAGAGALRVPVELGGGGVSLRELFAFVVRLARADANVAQSLRAHYHFVEGRLAAADPAERERWLPLVARGAIFGNATVERTTRDIFGFETTLAPAGDGTYRLNGTKYYSTGSLYADHVVVAARRVERAAGDGPDAAGEVVSVVVPADRDGVVLEDDWDGMGQRLTASGTSRFADVVVRPDEILPSAIGAPAPAPRGAFLQLYLVAVMAGIAAAAADDAAAVARGRSRTFSHASAELPAADPLIQEAVGRIVADAFAAESAVLAAAEALDAAVDPDGMHEAARRVAAAQVVVSELAVAAGARLFDAGGASATTRAANLDRHWRNARTVASHNPAMYKARALGDLAINGARLPTNGFF